MKLKKIIFSWKKKGEDSDFEAYKDTTYASYTCDGLNQTLAIYVNTHNDGSRRYFELWSGSFQYIEPFVDGEIPQTGSDVAPGHTRYIL